MVVVASAAKEEMERAEVAGKVMGMVVVSKALALAVVAMAQVKVVEGRVVVRKAMMKVDMMVEVMVAARAGRGKVEVERAQ